jgi:hypothetical protein
MDYYELDCCEELDDLYYECKPTSINISNFRFCPYCGTRLVEPYEPTSEDAKELRYQTGASVVTCKAALLYSKGDMDKAKAWLREYGIVKC